MIPDPIVEEVRRTRETIFAEFNGDLADLVDHLQKSETKAGRQIVSLPPRQPDAETNTGRKAG